MTNLFGIKQSGDMYFKIANLKSDYKILVQAKKDALEFLKSDKNNSYFYAAIEQDGNGGYINNVKTYDSYNYAKVYIHTENTQNGITPFILKNGTNQQKNISILVQYVDIKAIVRLLKRKALTR